jgi:hypothetical protein
MAKSCVIIQGFADRNRLVKTLGIERGCAAKNFGTGLAKAKICVIIEGFADRGAKRQNEKRLRKINKIFEAGTKKRATIQGFADRGEAGDESCKIFKNIQPISVGV